MGVEGRVRIGDRDGTNLAIIARTIEQVGLLADIRFGARPRDGPAARRSRSARPISRTAATSASSSAPSSSILAISERLAAPARVVAGPHDRARRHRRRRRPGVHVVRSIMKTHRASSLVVLPRRRARAQPRAATCRRPTPTRGEHDRARRRGAARRRRRCVAHYRPRRRGRRSRRSSSCGKDDTQLGRRRAGDAVVAPGLEYYLAAGDAAGVRVAASWPHTTARRASRPHAERRARDELRVEGRRSRDPGDRASSSTTARARSATVELADQLLPDRCRLRVPAVGVSARGDARRLHAADRRDAEPTVCDGAAACTADAGFKVAGWFELGLAAGRGRAPRRARMR